MDTCLSAGTTDADFLTFTVVSLDRHTKIKLKLFKIGDADIWLFDYPVINKKRVTECPRLLGESPMWALHARAQAKCMRLRAIL